VVWGRYGMEGMGYPVRPALLVDLLRFIRLVAHRSLTSLAYPLLRTDIAHIYQISPRKVQRCLACHRHFCLPILGIFATVRPNCRRGTRTSACYHHLKRSCSITTAPWRSSTWILLPCGDSCTRSL